MHALEAQKDRVFVAPALAWLSVIMESTSLRRNADFTLLSYGTLEDAEAFGYPPSKAESVGYSRELAIAVPGLVEMKKRGIRVMPGGDYGYVQTNPCCPRQRSLTSTTLARQICVDSPWVSLLTRCIQVQPTDIESRFRTYRDPELFVTKLGYTPMESILAATALGGELMMHPEELGKVQPGYYADLLLVDGNPLEDITLLSHHTNLDVILIVS